MPMKITYATMSTDNEEMNAAYEQALETVKPRLGQDHGVIVNGEHRTDRPFHEEVSPIDSGLVVGRYAQASPSDVDDAVISREASERIEAALVAPASFDQHRSQAFAVDADRFAHGLEAQHQSRGLRRRIGARGVFRRLHEVARRMAAEISSRTPRAA